MGTIMDIETYTLLLIFFLVLIFSVCAIYCDRHHARETEKHKMEKQIINERDKNVSKSLQKALDIVENNLVDLSMGMRKRTGWIYNKDDDLTYHSVERNTGTLKGTLKDRSNVEDRGNHCRNTGSNAPRSLNNAGAQVSNEHSQVSSGRILTINMSIH